MTHGIEYAVGAAENLETFGGLVLVDKVTLGPYFAARESGVVRVHVLFVQRLLLIGRSKEAGLSTLHENRMSVMSAI